ncbi:sodium-coupled monocarboxylate transporter 1 [Contarinia nasturtii]|uniref:sodium-coupled monocarboxylate transporter 1 n=1 Tax=Contarinia nasturtii TaxID=265458 RepID=UPI0012D49073|nr:sodium-coupled monocarboxylate transporter 1 [Contarinia nasturtii]
MSSSNGIMLDDVKISMQKFGTPDYLVFLVMLVICALIGIYFGFFEKKSSKKCDEESDYLVGGRQMKVIPITMSLIASYISGITLLGIPTEIYVYGIQYMFIIFGLILTGIAMTYIYLPVFHDLQLTSTYHYLETRFDNRVRMFGAVLFTFGTMMWLPIVIYVPALAFNQITGVNVHWITPLVCLVCIFYTCVGGLKAVVWTDCIQLVMMFGAIILVMVKGTIDIGGFGLVWEKAVESGRIELPEFAFDLKTRYTIYSVIFGGFAQWLKSNAISQNMIQRYLALPTLRDAKIAHWLFIVGTLALALSCSYCGLLIYATYHDCDPLTTRLAKAKDQLLPLLVMKLFSDFPGLPGLFVSGVFSAALSSLSTGLNSMSAVILEDFVKPQMKRPLTKKQTHYVMRFVVAIFGGICVCLVFLVEKLGAVLQLSISLSAISNGPLLGIFTMGVLLPWIGATAVVFGGATSLGVMAWICIRAQAAIASGELYHAIKPVDTQGCGYIFMHESPLNMLAINSTDAPTLIDPVEPEFAIYHISYLWYTLLGALICIGVSVIVSTISGFNNPREMDPKMFAPFIRKCLKLEMKREEPVGTEDDIRYASCVDLKAISSST